MLTTPAADDDPLHTAVDGVGLRPAYQPVVAFPDLVTVGFEGLARWPSLNRPAEEVIAYAGRTGQLASLDRTCVGAVLADAHHAGLPEGTLLFVRCETEAPLEDLDIARNAGLDVVFEITERHLLERPRAVLDSVARLRDNGLRVAVDDVGVERGGLALLDVVSPDVVKLQLPHLRSIYPAEQARVMSAVLAHRDRTGATILAEGVETTGDMELAAAFGAELGQGSFFGRPGLLDGAAVEGRWAGPHTSYAAAATRTPFEVVAAATTPRVMRKDMLTQMSRFVERQTAVCGDSPILLTGVQHADHFRRHTAELYTELAAAAPLVAVFGRGLRAEPAPGVRGVALQPDDPVCAEWIVIALGTHTACALAGREVVDRTGLAVDPDRVFEAAVTYDRTAVLAAAHAMLQRIP